MFYSSNDPVLRTDYPLGSFGHQALGRYGPRLQGMSKVRAFDCSRIVPSHGGYRFVPEYYAAWRSILDGTAKPGITVL